MSKRPAQYSQHLQHHPRDHGRPLPRRPASAAAVAVAASAPNDGYTIVRWTADGLELAAVSDIDSRELLAFRDAFRARAAPPT